MEIWSVFLHDRYQSLIIRDNWVFGIRDLKLVSIADLSFVIVETCSVRYSKANFENSCNSWGYCFWKKHFREYCRMLTLFGTGVISSDILCTLSITEVFNLFTCSLVNFFVFTPSAHTSLGCVLLSASLPSLLGGWRALTRFVSAKQWLQF